VYGGHYWDFKSSWNEEPIKKYMPLPPMVLSNWSWGNQKEALVEEDPHGRGEIQNWHFLSVPTHPLFKLLIDYVTDIILDRQKREQYGKGKEDVLRITGPIALSKCWYSLLPHFQHLLTKGEHHLGYTFDAIGKHEKKSWDLSGAKHYSKSKDPVILKEPREFSLTEQEAMELDMPRMLTLTDVNTTTLAEATALNLKAVGEKALREFRMRMAYLADIYYHVTWHKLDLAKHIDDEKLEYWGPVKKVKKALEHMHFCLHALKHPMWEYEIWKEDQIPPGANSEKIRKVLKMEYFDDDFVASCMEINDQIIMKMTEEDFMDHANIDEVSRKRMQKAKAPPSTIGPYAWGSKSEGSEDKREKGCDVPIIPIRSSSAAAASSSDKQMSGVRMIKKMPDIGPPPRDEPKASGEMQVKQPPPGGFREIMRKSIRDALIKPLPQPPKHPPPKAASSSSQGEGLLERARMHKSSPLPRPWEQNEKRSLNFAKKTPPWRK